MSMTKPSVIVSNPDKIIEIDGESFASLILHQCLHVENLRRAVQAMSIINADDKDERLTELQIIMQAMSNSASGVLVAHVRIATTQGLEFQLSDESTTVRH